MKRSRTKHTHHLSPPPAIPDSMAALASGMVDNFNNILTTVMGACSLIDRDDSANTDLLRYVALIRSSAERAADLSDRLMRASTPEQKHLVSDVHLYGSGTLVTSVRDKKPSDDVVSVTIRSGDAAQ